MARNGTLTLEAFADHKRLPADHLRKSGFSQLADGIGIAYLDEAGIEYAVKRRTTLKAGEGSYWPKDTPLSAFGRWRIHEAAKAGILFLVEGESDALTLWLHDLPALGLPGSCTAKTLLADHIVGVSTIYVAHEPDKGGDTFVAQVVKRLRELRHDGKALQLDMPAGIKDVSELHLADSGKFRDRLQECIQSAKPLACQVSGDRAFESNGKLPEAGATLAEVEGFQNYRIMQQEVETKDGVKTVEKKVGLAGDVIANRLLSITDNWPKRVGSLLFVADNAAPVYLEQVSQLFGWIAKALPKRKGENDANPVRWCSGDDKLSQQHFDAYLRQSVENYAAVNPYPHEPKLDGHYYLHAEPKPTGGKALEDLLSRFNPATQVDRSLLLAFFLTLVWGGRPGQRPAFLFTADHDERGGRGVGKTTLVEVGSQLVGGYIAAASQDSFEDLKKRILSPEGRSRRVLLIDNVKTLKFSWAEMEGFITCQTISGKQMYVGEGRVPNTFVVCVTVNGATLSKDMAQRCVIIQLTRPTYSATWKTEVELFIAEHRWEIIGDLLDILRQPPKTLERYCRWGTWEAGVLSHVNDPAACQAAVESRQAAVDDDQDEQDLIRDAFAEALAAQKFAPEIDVVLIPSQVAAGIVERATGEKRPTNKASAYLKTLGISELRKSDRGKQRGWVWSGKNSEAGAPAKPWEHWHD